MKQSVKIVIGEYRYDLPTPVTAFIDELQDLVSETPHPYLQDVLIDQAVNSRGYEENGYVLYYYRPETPEEEQERELCQIEVDLRMKDLERAQYERLKAKVERGEI